MGFMFDLKKINFLNFLVDFGAKKMGRWSKAKIKENALELVDALNEHFKDDLSDLEKLKNAYDICAYHCDSSFTMRFLRRYAIDEELEKHHKNSFWNSEFEIFWLEENSKVLQKEVTKTENEIIDLACEILSNKIRALEKLKSEND